ncbi:MAG: hypothetical protein BWX88_02903 [Planctomycetes bacterium ADurb.Bin126]|nr:MAG: hypothetical protein BWX88_02903 [Planctomycetes bacterium ADurb.Bin126]HOD83354.1 hypothetical protein [Phycisphaerae bacterium]HQL76106.1 hypothetical protein [Phycisphaerae bacterium]
MTLAQLRDFFMWCTIINGGLLLLTLLVFVAGRDWAYRMHSRFFPMSKDAFVLVLYCGVGFLKILFLVFNLVPWIALLIVG